MKGRQHIQISLLTGLIVVSPFILSDAFTAVLFLMGLLIGSLLPDSDASDRTAAHKEGVIWIFDKVNELLIYPVILVIFHERKRHRGILHTIVGVLIFSLILTAITGIAFYFLKIPWNSLIIGIGLFTGGILHLMEDCCTISGVNPFYPKLRKYVLKGNISTTNLAEKRPDQFSQVLMIVLVIVMMTPIYAHLSQLEAVGMVILALVLSWLGFFLICKVRKKPYKSYNPHSNKKA